MKLTDLSELSPKERAELAERSGITPGMLRQYANGHRTPSAERAIRIERAAKTMRLYIPRSSMAAGCATCEYAAQCERVLKKGAR